MKLQPSFLIVAFINWYTASRQKPSFGLDLEAPSNSNILLSNSRCDIRLCSNSIKNEVSEDTQCSKSEVCITSPPDNFEFHEILVKLSNRHKIPVVQYDVRTHDSNGANDHQNVSNYSHCIHILPYEFGGLKTYAIGIQPIKDQMERNPRRQKKKKFKSRNMQPVHIDFCPSSSSSLGKRFSNTGGEMLLKAVAISKYGDASDGAVVCDLCAGFGQDSMILASHSSLKKLYMVERDPIVGMLLHDAIRRLNLIAEMDDCTDSGMNNDRNKARFLAKRLHLKLNDSVSFCKEMLEINKINSSAVDRPDICYLDPMFPPRTKSAAVKKNMQILHGLFQTNGTMSEDRKRSIEERELLQVALSLAKSRVVVKRPVNAPALGYQSEDKMMNNPSGIDSSDTIQLPSFHLKGSVNRFDIYLI
mmetsp:Transcript_24839/g.36729  ORF Transcript_24839/g.36729 Transcript_24839/m.36729 type:complete len:417 (+) Transcript_24839:179-1429(+)